MVSSVAVPISGAVFGAGAANDPPARCEANSFGIEDVVSGVGPPSGEASVVLVSVSSRFDEEGAGLPRLIKNAEPVVAGSGWGIVVASAGAGGADSACPLICCVG